MTQVKKAQLGCFIIVLEASNYPLTFILNVKFMLVHIRWEEG